MEKTYLFDHANKIPYREYWLHALHLNKQVYCIFGDSYDRLINQSRKKGQRMAGGNKGGENLFVKSAAEGKQGTELKIKD